jgi:hypothetical protein
MTMPSARSDGHLEVAERALDPEEAIAGLLVTREIVGRVRFADDGSEGEEDDQPATSHAGSIDDTGVVDLAA